jgi:hypothetical protein
LPEFRVPLVVPYRNASRDVDGITSRTPFTRVLRLISDRMDVPLTLLAGIGYVPSYKPKSSKPVPKLLEDDASWYKLLEDVHAFILSCKGKTGKGAIKPYHVNIVDTTAPTELDSKVSARPCTGDNLGLISRIEKEESCCYRATCTRSHFKGICTTFGIKEA